MSTDQTGLMMRRLTLTLAAGALATLAGCSGAADATEAASTPQVSTPQAVVTVTATPTPTEISTADAGAQYLALVGPYNAANAEYNAVANREWDQPAISAAATKLADTNQAFVQGLSTSEWPASVQSTVDQLALEAAPLTTYMRQMANAQTELDAVAVIANKPDLGGNGSAQLLRIKLGLAEVPITDRDTSTPAPTRSA